MDPAHLFADDDVTHLFLGQIVDLEKIGRWGREVDKVHVSETLKGKVQASEIVVRGVMPFCGTDGNVGDKVIVLKGVSPDGDYALVFPLDPISSYAHKLRQALREVKSNPTVKRDARQNSACPLP
jgi:hypothetical protein